MSAPPTRRSSRVRASPPPVPNCEWCDRKMEAWRPVAEENTVERCPDCHHATTRDGVSYLEHINQYHSSDEQNCTCYCECGDADIPGDEDFEADDMDLDEDDLTTRLDERTEHILTSNYGIFTNVLLNENSSEERRIFFEGPGHFAVGSSHDIGRPAESSLVNPENYITRRERTALADPLRNWEAEAVYHASGRSWNQMQQMWPELQEMREPIPAGVDDPQIENYICPNCNKSVTDGFMRWLQTGRVRVCTLCRTVRRPESPEEDPDWYQHSISNFANTADALEHCRCRCNCHSHGLTFQHAEAEANSVIAQPARFPVEDSESDTDYGPPRIIRDDAVARPELIHMSDIVIDIQDETVPEQLFLLQRCLRAGFGLPELEIVSGFDLAQAIIDSIQPAIQAAELSMTTGDWEFAYRYLQVAGQMGRYLADLRDSDRTMMQIFRHLRTVYEHILDRSERSEDTMEPETIEDILDRHDAASE